MFATLFFEHEPIKLADLPTLFVSWVRIVGGLAAVAVVLWVLIGLPRLRPADRARIPGWQSRVFTLALIGLALFYGLFLLSHAGASLGRSASKPASRALDPHSPGFA